MVPRIHNSKKIKEKSKKQLVLGDDAIAGPDTDWFDFEASASGLAKQLYEVSLSSGVCCGISGSWGSGKSSFMNLMKDFVEKKFADNACVAWFTAWDPGGIADLGDAMLYNFAHSIAAGGDDEGISKAVADLDEALGLRKSAKARARQLFNILSKLAPEGGGQVLESIGATLEELNTPKKIQQSFEAIVKWLKENNKTVFFFLDDLDRSTGEQIFDLLSELKVYVSHPRIVAVLAYDEEYVLNALKTSLPSGIDANKYLEKIVTVRRDLPRATRNHPVSIASAVLRSSLGIEEDDSKLVGEFASEIALMNPRRLKRLLLTFAGSLPRNWKEEAGADIKSYCISALVVCAAADAGFLRNQELLSILDDGNEDEIVSALNSIGEKEKSCKPIADVLTKAVNYVDPNFETGLIGDLRFAAIPEEIIRERRGEQGTERELLIGWKGIVEPIFTRAMSAGFRLNSDLATFSGSIVFLPQGRKVDTQEFIRSVAKDERTQRSLARLLGLRSFEFLAYKNREANVLVMIGPLIGPRHMRTALPYDFDAELTIERPFVFWAVSILEAERSVMPEEWRRVMDQVKTRSKSFKHPFLLALTSPSQVNALFSFLLNQAPKKAASA